ncbi:AAA family ATPase [Desulfobulbus rhabdoformis]|uniref:ATP-binding protein n=1 Tax=Desulfobulbus rhabdoformis TaxID=34032 RepID=UPI00196642A4|nr:AAA family ATPase [Desulfobulbus rhabdoformis]MBM9612686.1 AAA family ATPase [Desulfobulbus rhabdoformis]
MDKKRVLEEKINQLLDMFPVVTIIGPRQCGKSTLVSRLRDDWKYYDLESPDDYQLINDAPGAFFSLTTNQVIINEAQQFPDLFKVLRGVVDADRKRKGRFLLTGSSSPEIVKGITESLAGRIATVELWPFKQNELHEKPLPTIYEIIIDGAAGPKDFLALQPVLPPKQSMVSKRFHG